MEKFSVKKPFTVLVAVVMVLILGFVAITKMQTNLLPDVSTPYLMVVTVYPGASPERVESEVSDVLQNALTVPGVENITATSAENYSLLLMHFTDDTDMNSALVKVSNKLDQAKSDLPSSCLTPSIIEYSLNMNAFMTVAVSREGSDIYQMSELVKDTLVPYVQRKGGVSNVSSSGLVEKLVQVQLNQDKIDGINAKLLELIDTQLAAARSQLESAEAQSVSIPLGAALGVPFLSAMGPLIPVRIVPVSAVSAAFSTEFESAGINQTRHKIYLSLQTSVRLVIPSGARQVLLQSQVLIAESIIVGEVPQSYVSVPETGDALNFAIP